MSKFPAIHSLPEFKQDIIEILVGLRTEQKALESSMRHSVLTSTPFVVQLGDMYLIPKIVTIDGKRQTVAGRVNSTRNPIEATRFCREDADSIASNCNNGNGEKGKAIGIYQAVRERLPECINDIKVMEETLERIEQKLANEVKDAEILASEQSQQGDSDEA